MIYLRLKGFIRIFYKKSKNCHRSQNLKGALSWVFGNAIEIAVEETTNSTFLACARTNYKQHLFGVCLDSRTLAAAIATFCAHRPLSRPQSFLNTGIHQLEHLWLLFAVQQHKRNAWPDHCWGRCFNHSDSLIVEHGGFAGEQDCCDGSAWCWWYDYVACLQDAEGPKSCLSCLTNSPVCAIHDIKVDLRPCIPPARPPFCTTRLPLCSLV